MEVLLGQLQRRQRRALGVIAAGGLCSLHHVDPCATPGAGPGSWLNKLGAQATSVAAEKAATKSAKAAESAKLVAQALIESEAEREFMTAPSATATFTERAERPPAAMTLSARRCRRCS